jgi:uncharacterized alpha-E superfamily protein
MICIEKIRKTTSNIAEFFNIDKEFPRSILACLINAEQSLTLSGNLLGLIIQHKKKIRRFKIKTRNVH